MTPFLQKEERLDDLGRNGYRIIQNVKNFCFGIDAVLLAEFASISPRARVADLGCGNGILPLLLKARGKGGQFDALEIQEEMARLAIRNMKLNCLEEEVKVWQADLTRASQILGKNVFDSVVSNPPYIKIGDGLMNPRTAKAVARHEVCCTIEDVIREGGALLKESGSLFLVYRCWRMAEVMALLPRFGLRARRMRLVHSFSHQEGELFLLEAKKGRREGLKIEAPCVIYESPGRFTEEVYLACHGRGRREEE
ncbi:MAG: methyltransferase [Lachnospiraceae bacterium]|nr:methyltransferase [Lachnospiraceae bacterium]